MSGLTRLTLCIYMYIYIYMQGRTYGGFLIHMGVFCIHLFVYIHMDTYGGFLYIFAVENSPIFGIDPREPFAGMCCIYVSRCYSYHLLTHLTLTHTHTHARTHTHTHTHTQAHTR